MANYVIAINRFSPEKCCKVHQLSMMDVLCSSRQRSFLFSFPGCPSLRCFDWRVVRLDCSADRLIAVFALKSITLCTILCVRAVVNCCMLSFMYVRVTSLLYSVIGYKCIQTLVYICCDCKDMGCVRGYQRQRNTVKPVFFACPLFREPDEFAKITGRENLNTVAFRCSRNQKRQNYGSKIIKSTQTSKLRVAKIKGFTVYQLLAISCDDCLEDTREKSVRTVLCRNVYHSCVRSREQFSHVNQFLLIQVFMCQFLCVLRNYSQFVLLLVFCVFVHIFCWLLCVQLSVPVQLIVWKGSSLK